MFVRKNCLTLPLGGKRRNVTVFERSLQLKSRISTFNRRLDTRKLTVPEKVIHGTLLTFVELRTSETGMSRSADDALSRKKVTKSLCFRNVKSKKKIINANIKIPLPC